MLFKPCISLRMSYIHVTHVVSVTSTELEHVMHVVCVTSTELPTCYSCRAYHLELDVTVESLKSMETLP